MNVLHVGFGFRPLRWGGLIAYAEDLMDAQVARGHQVGWFCVGRAYPFGGRTRLRRWKRRGVQVFEVLNTPIPLGGDKGTVAPHLEVSEPETERLFAETLERFRPDVVHVQELLGVPTAIFRIARERGVPILMTLEDYQPLCPTLKLHDAEGNICLRRQPGEMCAVCCRDAPFANAELIGQSTLHDQAWVIEHVPGLKRVPRPEGAVKVARQIEHGATAAYRRLRGRGEDDGNGAAPPAPVEERTSNAASPAEYDARRDGNVANLNHADLLIAMSTRVGEIYTELDVDPERVRVLHLTLDHIAKLRPRRIERVDGPVQFVTLAGCASPQKGSNVVEEAIRLLRSEHGLTEADYRLTVKGFLDPLIKPTIDADPAVEYEWFYGPEHMEELLDRFHVGIVPSIWEEAYGYVGVELLAKGVPVLGNAVGGITDYCRDGETGWLNRDLTGAGLAERMAHIVRHREEIPERNAWILEHRDELVKSLPDHVAEMDAVYAELAAARR